MEVIDFLKPQVLLQCMQYSHVDLHVTAQLMSGCPGREREEYLPALSFHSKSRQAEKHCGIPTKQLGRTCLSLTKQSSGNSPVFQAAPAPQHKMCSTRNQGLRLLFDRNGMELHYNRVCWGKGMNPCPVCFMGDPLSHYRKIGSFQLCRAVCTASEGTSLPRGLLPVNREWHFVECGWGGPVTPLCCQSALQAIILSKVIPALCLSLLGRCSLFFIKY